MAELILERDQRLALRADAHNLPVTVLLGTNGLTEAVMQEIDRALRDHGLIKVHFPTDEREERVEAYQRIAEELSCARIQLIGKRLIFWREPEKKHAEEVKKPLVHLGAKADPGAKGIKKREPAKTGTGKRTAKPAKKVPFSKAGKHGTKPVIKARRTRVTKKSALS